MMTNRRELTAGKGSRPEDGHEVGHELGHDVSLAVVMLRYCRGDQEAFTQLYDKVATILFKELIARSGDPLRATRLLESTFLSLHQSRALYVEGADPLPWIMQMGLRELELDARPGWRRASSRVSFWSRVRSMLGSAAQLEVTRPAEDLRDPC